MHPSPCHGFFCSYRKTTTIINITVVCSVSPTHNSTAFLSNLQTPLREFLSNSTFKAFSSPTKPPWATALAPLDLSFGNWTETRISTGLLTTHRTWRSWWLGRSFRDLYFTTPSITIASLIIGVLINLKKHLRDFQSIGLCTDWFFPSRVCASQHPSSSCHYKRIITPALRWQHLLVVSL